MDATPSLKMLWLKFPNPASGADGKELEAKKVKQAIYKLRQQEIQLMVSEERDGKESSRRT